MKKLIFYLCLCLSTILVGCMTNKDMMPDSKTDENPPVTPDPDDGGYRKNTDWFDTLRPPLNPNIVEYKEAIVPNKKENANPGGMTRNTQEGQTTIAVKK